MVMSDLIIALLLNRYWLLLHSALSISCWEDIFSATQKNTEDKLVSSAKSVLDYNHIICSDIKQW